MFADPGHKCRLQLKNLTTTIHWLIWEYPWPLLYFRFRVFPTFGKTAQQWVPWTICMVYVNACETQACHNLTVAEVKFPNWYSANEDQHVQNPKPHNNHNIPIPYKQLQISWGENNKVGFLVSISMAKFCSMRAGKCAGKRAVKCTGKPTCFKTATKTKFQKCPWHGGCNSRWNF